MSKIGKKPIELPTGTQVQFADGTYTVEGPKGKIQVPKLAGVEITQSGSTITFQTSSTDKQAQMNWGTQRALVASALVGVTEGYAKSLEMEGVGFRAAISGNNLELRVGFSHPVLFPIPEGISITVEKNKITVAGIEKERVGQIAANIRKIKKPEPYLGKGIRYSGEVIRRKAGKKAGAATK
jgi:large subunit ribosomal protein L6